MVSFRLFLATFSASTVTYITYGIVVVFRARAAPGEAWQEGAGAHRTNDKTLLMAEGRAPAEIAICVSATRLRT